LQMIDAGHGGDGPARVPPRLVLRASTSPPTLTSV
jgi:hypothetical protein